MRDQALVDVSVVIGADENLVFACLDSLSNGNARYISGIHVVSNCASPRTVESIRHRYPSVHLIVNDEPKGFATNHNAVLAHSTSPYVLVLNDDTVVRPLAVDRMVEWAEDHPDVGIVGPKLLNPDGSLQRSTYDYPNLAHQILVFTGLRRFVRFTPATYRLVSLFRREGVSGFWAHDRIRLVKSVKGACMLVRRGILQDAGYMDEVTFAYEEIEWQFRITKSGWKVAFLPHAEVVHYGGRTTSATPHTAVEMVKASLNFFEKHRSRLSYHLLRVALAFVHVTRLVAAALASNDAAAEAARLGLRATVHPNQIFEGKPRY